MQIPTANAIVAAFDGWVVAPDERDSLAITGYGGWRREASSLRLTAHLKQGGDVEIEMKVHAFSDNLAISSLLFREIHARPRLRFPLEIRIERTKQTIPVEGRRRSFEVLTVGETAFARASLGSASVHLLGRREALGHMRLVRLTAAEVRRLVKEYRERHRDASSRTALARDR